MKESIGSTWIFGLVISFMLIFVAYLTVTINYSRTYKVKNDVISIVEKNEGLTPTAKTTIANYLNASGYKESGKCKEGIGYNLNGEQVNNGSTASFCVKKVCNTTDAKQRKAYYEIELFFKFNLPVVGSIFNFRVTGESLDITYPADTSGDTCVDFGV